MKEEEQYTLGEAIKRFHVTEPLQDDFSAKVAALVFEKPAKEAAVNKGLYWTGGILMVAGIVYSISLLSRLEFLPVFVVLCVAGVYSALAVKEYFVVARRLGVE